MVIHVTITIITILLSFFPLLFGIRVSLGDILEVWFNTMEIRYYDLAEAHLAEGVVIVIDVLRAFTTAAYAFQGGARKIFPVGEVAEALALRTQIPGSLVMGEEGGYRPEAFDLSNSPTEIRQMDLHGEVLIQRTSAGTQGLVRAKAAAHLLAASFVIARATADFVKNLSPHVVSIIITGASRNKHGADDRACGEYIAELLRGHDPNPVEFTKRVWDLFGGKGSLRNVPAHFGADDLDLSLQVNLFDFCLITHQEGPRRVITTIFPGGGADQAG